MDGVKSHKGQTAHDVYESKRVMHNETHEEVKEIHEVTKTDEGGIPEEVLGPMIRTKEDKHNLEKANSRSQLSQMGGLCECQRSG